MDTLKPTPPSGSTRAPKKGKHTRVSHETPGRQQEVGNFMRRVATGDADELGAMERQVTQWYSKKPRPEPAEPKGAANIQGSHPLKVR